MWDRWVRFWFAPADPAALHVVRVLTGLLFLAWLLPFAGQVEAFFGLGGWYDTRAYAEAARLPGGPPVPAGWSVLYLCGTNSAAVLAVYWVSIAVLVLFTLGIAPRVTAVLTYVITASFTANPAVAYDADALLVLLAFYLMVGYVLLGQRQPGQSLAARLLGPRDGWLFSRHPGPAAPSVGANVALRLLQVHFAVAMLASGLHKLQFGDWWSGVAFWYPLHRPFESTAQSVRAWAANRESYLFVLSLSAYAVLTWQIAFPVYAWRRRWRLLLIGGAALGWLGHVFIYKMPLMGPASLIGCLAYLSGEEWRRLGERLAQAPGIGGLMRRLWFAAEASGKGARTGSAAVSVGQR